MRAGGNVTADLRIAILKAFRETGVSISSRQPDTLQAIDLLRETAEYLSINFQKTGVENRKIVSKPSANSAKRPANLVSS
jgi:potassium-dependent mechanosensitive channel